MRRAKLLILVCAALVIVAACAWRIHDVNARAIRYPTERYGIGDNVPLEGGFFADATENTDGYSLRIDGAQAMSYNDYVRTYGVEGAQTVEGLDEASIICLTVTITNDSDKTPDQGGFNISLMSLVKPDGSGLMRVDTKLWSQAEPGLAESPYAASTGVLPHTSYTTHIPLSAGLLTRDTLADQASGGVDAEYRQPVEPGSYDLYLSVMPTRKLVTFDV